MIYVIIFVISTIWKDSLDYNTAIKIEWNQKRFGLVCFKELEDYLTSNIVIALEECLL